MILSFKVLLLPHHSFNRYHVAELFEEPTTTEAIYDFLQDRISREVPRTSVVLGKEIGKLFRRPPALPLRVMAI